MSDSNGAAIPADWYPDPLDAGRLRWWNGATWTEHAREAAPAVPVPVPLPVPVPVPVPIPDAVAVPPYVPMARRDPAFAIDLLLGVQPGSPHTVAVWLLAFLPLATITSFLIQLYGGAPVFVSLIVQLIVLFVVAALAMWDAARLRTRGFEPASPWWILLSPLAYLIARRIRVRRQGAPSAAPGNVFALNVLAAVVVVVVVTLSPGAHFGPQYAAAYERQIDLLGQQNGRVWVAHCPDDVAIQAGAGFDCSVTDEGRQFSVHVAVTNDAGSATYSLEPAAGAVAS